MQALNQFSIPIIGLKFGIHEYDFEILKDFFDAFEDAPIKNGHLRTHMVLDRKSNHLEIHLQTKGTIDSECDRCTANINLPVQGAIDFIAKFSDDQASDGEIFYFPADSHEINVAEMVYEHIILTIPMIKVYDCLEEESLPCNEDVLDVLEGVNDEEEKTEVNSPFGEALKNLKITKTK